jgi:hypothetical protein
VTSRRGAWLAWSATVALLALWMVVAIPSGELANDVLAYILFPPAILGFATVGTLINARQRTTGSGGSSRGPVELQR